MKKVALVVSAALLVSSAAYSMDLSTMLNGHVQIGTYLAKGENSIQSLDYSAQKAELWVKNANFVAELDLDLNNDALKENVVVDQAYGIFNVAGGKLNVGRIETGMTMVDYFSVLLPTGEAKREVEGLGFTFNTEISGFDVTFGNFGNIIADENDSVSNRDLFMQVGYEVMPETMVWLQGIMSTQSTSGDTNIDGAVEFSYKGVENLTVNGLLVGTASNEWATHSKAELSLAAKYLATNDVSVYGSFGMGLAEGAKANDVESDLIIGTAYQIDDVTSVLAEYKTTTLNEAETNADLILGARIKF